ncbi:7TM diverse intracellular signaling domain-containing protein [Uliginosibacterium sp. 31-16]|uniref:7TM diverse intracellular signaling domain-containing protein n=1 Tax=Uliginosibacterium sp. 31-16 TaxID=3068315 RepID=UPI00273D1ED3|nr:7TM diverse intracellular signaling domain-containing protein [Uliginosibacterium sp. 31-16]MDP5238562.1 7TM diverse intracellular signaling domain-containing protein [Uliginosibacterium sp. 31-16]
MRRFWYLTGLCLFAFFCVGTSVEVAAAKAMQGEIDLRSVDTAKGETAYLDGEWEFYWGHLLEPADFAEGRLPAVRTMLHVPSSWSDTSFGAQELPTLGHATYRLKIIPPPGKQEFGLRMADVSSAFKLWVNGRLVMENGIVGDSLRTETEYRALRIPRFVSNGEPIELLMQVSNYHYRYGGLVVPIQFGASRILDVAQVMRWGLIFVVIGCLLVMGIYHLVLYLTRRCMVSPLYFGFYCLLWTISSLCSSASDWIIRVYLPNLTTGFLYPLEMISLFVSIPVGYAFFHSLYPQEFSARLRLFAAAAAAVFSLFALVASPLALSRAVPWFYIFSMGVMGYALIRLFKAARLKRDGARLILCGFLFVGAAGMNDMFNDMQIIHTPWMIPAGMFIFVLFQAFALAHRYSMAFQSIENLSDKLEEQNADLQDEMAERTRLEREIVHVSEEERRNISRDLHDGMCQQLTAARLHCSVLESRYAGSGPEGAEIAKLAILLEESVDQAYELSRGLWPVEHDARSLVSSLEELAGRIQVSQGDKIALQCELNCGNCCNSNSNQIYSIAKEALLNSLKHASAQSIRMTLDCCSSPSNLILRVEDDGVGRQVKSLSRGGLGTRIMAHRARIIGGLLSISDRAGGGTVVECIVPCSTWFRPQDATLDVAE